MSALNSRQRKGSLQNANDRSLTKELTLLMGNLADNYRPLSIVMASSMFVACCAALPM